MDMRGNPNAPQNPYQPQRPPTYGVNNPTSYAQQVNAGRTQYQPNQAGLGQGTNTTGYGRGGYTQQPQAVYDPPVSIPTGEVPPVYHGGTAAPPIPAWAVPGGRHQYDQSGMSTYTNPTTGLQSWGGGNGWVPAPPGSGVAYMRQQQPQGFGGFNMHDLFNRDRSRFGGY